MVKIPVKSILKRLSQVAFGNPVLNTDVSRVDAKRLQQIAKASRS